MSYNSGLSTAEITGSLTSSQAVNYVAGDTNIIASIDDTYTQTAVGAYAKATQFTLPSTFVAKKLRISFTFVSGSGSSGTNYARIYKNGVAYGTERTKAYNDTTPATYTEDLSFSAGDTIEIWSYKSVSGSGYCRTSNFRITGILYDIPPDMVGIVNTTY